MQTRRSRLAAAGLLLVALVATACTSGASPAPSATPSEAPPSGGGSDGAVGSGADQGGGSVDPGGGAPPPADGTLVFPKPGVIDPQPVTVSGLTASIDGDRVVARVEWTSGVEPCYTLAGVDVQREGDTFTLTVLEGASEPNAICIEIAMFKATLVDLGALPAGTYTIAADPSDVPPVEITVP
jgi:hypothetical protein